MFKIQCLLAFTTLFTGLVCSWDIAVTTKDEIEFYSNTTKTYSKRMQFRDLTALSYDAVHKMLLFANKNYDNASIFSFYLATKKQQPLVGRTSYDNIHGLAFDPVKGLLFWTDTNGSSIFWISMKPGSKNGTYGNLLFKMDDEIPKGIAVDSCRGKIYWTNTNISKPTIERARLDGSDREVIIDTDIHMPVSIAVDQQTKRIYWADDKEGIRFTIESADLDGKNRQILLDGVEHRPIALTVSKDSIYWLDLDNKAIWKLPKNASHNKPMLYMEFTNEVPFGIAANYPIEEQIRGQECKALEDLPLNNTDIIQSFNITTDVDQFCVHGNKINGRAMCDCTPGYTGERCDTSVCQNYCLQGDCSFTADGQPACRCKTGYLGFRCETYVCNNYCLNNGRCSLIENNEPTCQCMGDYEGTRCETPKIIITTTTAAPTSMSLNDSASPVCHCNVTQNNTETQSPTSNDVITRNTSRSVSLPVEPFTQIVDEIVPSCTEEWDPVRDPVIMALGILVGILCLICVVLATKVLQLKKRPRIKKRIIVNKNVTPMTARPDQCEITIENCCNMNICETPCFEPRSTIRPSLLDSKPGKDEKKNLIANMEYPDDPY